MSHNLNIEFMWRALQLARNGEGNVSPNPLVGAVIVHDNKIIGEGFHSLGDGCVFKEDFYYQMCGYDFDGDGVKEIVVAGGNKKDVLELRIFHINPGEEMKQYPEPVTEINGGMKSYVNAEGGICVQDSETHTTVYAYGEEK